MRKSKHLDPAHPARRRLIGALGVSAGALAAKTLPERWSRPVVDSVILPAHAQSSPVAPTAGGLRFSCSVVGLNTIDATGGMGNILMTITPGPGPGIPIQARGTCGMNLVFNVTQVFDFTTGQAIVAIGPTPGPPTCNVGDMLTVALTANTLGGLTSTCVFTVV